MTGKLAYNVLKSFSRLQSLFFHLISVVFFLLSVCSPFKSSGQDQKEYDEVLIYLYVRNLGGTEMLSYIQGKNLYLPIIDLFNFLKIQNTPSSGFDSVNGFFINPKAVFLFDRVNNRINYQQTVYDVNPDDFIQAENNLFLRSEYFGKVFGLNCDFDFRRLTVFLNTEVELPFIREMNREKMRANISRLKGEMKTDTTIKRNYPFFHFGAVDWSVSSSQEIKGLTRNLVTLNLGALLAGGEANINLIYNNSQPFRERQQYYQWHFANNDLTLLKQVFIGKFSATSISTISRPVIGFQVTNTPTTFNRSFGFYTIADYTQPGWIVELYVNYALVDYVRADASGYFTFEVPLVYGNTLVKLRFFGPWGEEYTREQIMSIPYNFIREKKFEYAISAGFVEDKQTSKYARAVFHYGLNRRLTLGGGVEYLSSIRAGSVMPFMNFSLRLASSLLVSGEYIYGVRLRGTASYRLRSNLMFEVYYTKMDRNQKAIIYNYLEERKAVISMPVHIPYFSSLMRLTFNQIIMPQTSTYSAEFLITGSLLGVSTNLITTALFSDPLYPYVSSELSLGFKLPAKFLVTPRVQYVYTQNQFLSLKVDLEKKILRTGVINMTYNRNFYSRTNNFQLGIRYDFPFAQTNFSARYSGNTTSLLEYARGSLIYEGKGGKLLASNYSAVGRGGVIILPFLDLNYNGKRDKNEKKVLGLTLHVTGGRIRKNLQDSTITISELEPYNKCFIELDGNSLNNISWRLPKATIGVMVNPNQYKLIEVPVIVVGEVSGFVYKTKGDFQAGLSNVTVGFFKNDSILIAKTTSETDGYFDYLGLPPGSYTVKIGKEWIDKFQMKCTPEKIDITLKQSDEGEIIDGLEFFLSPVSGDTITKDTTIQHIPVRAPKPGKTDTSGPVHVAKGTTVSKTQARSVELPVKSDSGRFHIQVGAFRVASNADNLQKELTKLLRRSVIIISEDGYYRVRITGFTNFKSASDFRQKLIREGYPDAFIQRNISPGKKN